MQRSASPTITAITTAACAEPAMAGIVPIHGATMVISLPGPSNATGLSWVDGQKGGVRG